MTPRGGRAVFFSSFGVQSYALFSYCTSKQCTKQQNHSVLAQLFSFTQPFAKPIQQIRPRTSPHKLLKFHHLPAAPHAIRGIFHHTARQNFRNSAGSHLYPSRIQPFHGGAKTENFRQKIRFFRTTPYFAPYALQKFTITTSIQSLKNAPAATRFRCIFGQETARRTPGFPP